MGQIVYSPKERSYFRVNPDKNNELQWASQLVGTQTQWQHAYDMGGPIIALDILQSSDTSNSNDVGRLCVIVNAYGANQAYISSGISALNRMCFASGTRIFQA